MRSDCCRHCCNKLCSMIWKGIQYSIVIALFITIYAFVPSVFLQWVGGTAGKVLAGVWWGCWTGCPLLYSLCIKCCSDGGAERSNHTQPHTDDVEAQLQLDYRDLFKRILEMKVRCPDKPDVENFGELLSTVGFFEGRSELSRQTVDDAVEFLKDAMEKGQIKVVNR